MSAPHRARILGTRHMASGGHSLAAQAAFQILEAGGNAVDAGVAGGLVLNVVLSEFVSFGGVAPIMISLAGGGEIVTISGLGWWPKASRLETFHREHGGRIPPGVLRTIVPAAPDAWITALARYGTMRFGEVAATAIRLARDGFPISSLSCEIIASYEKQLRRWPSNAALYLPKDRPPQPGECFALPDLARTMQHMADEERAAGGEPAWRRRGTPSTKAILRPPSPSTSGSREGGSRWKIWPSTAPPSSPPSSAGSATWTCIPAGLGAKAPSCRRRSPSSRGSTCIPWGTTARPTFTW